MKGKSEKALRMENIHKYFGKVAALKGINIQVGINEIVGIIGDNGAGKSTIVKILTGVFSPSMGEMYIKNKKVSFKNYNVRIAHKMGVEAVYQQRSLGEKQPLWRNFFIGRQITNRLGFINLKKEKEISSYIMFDLIGFRGAGVSADSTISKLSGGEQQGIVIGRAMYFNADLIVLDEPTASLSLKEIQKVLNFIKKIKKSGKACIYISHNISNVYEVSDRFIVIDRGEIAANFLKDEISFNELDKFLLEYATKK